MARRLFILNDAPYGTERATTASGSRAPFLDLLDLLSQGARTVEALGHQTGQSVATTSHHLQVLRRARLVEAHKAGLYVTYRLADPVGVLSSTAKSGGVPAGRSPARHAPVPGGMRCAGAGWQ
jgi:hypothetical protein